MTADKPPTPYELMGGEVAVQKLVDRFYHYMDNIPEVKAIRNMHTLDLESVKHKLFKFFSGLAGRARSLSARIRTSEAKTAAFSF